MKLAHQPSFRPTMYTSSSFFNMSDYARLWAWYYRNNILWHQRRDDRTPSISHTVIWHWRTGYKIVLRKSVGRSLGTTSGRHCCIQITSKEKWKLLPSLTNFSSTTLCLLHRAHMPPATATAHSNGQMNGYPEDAAYPSRNIAFQAAAMITSIVESLQAHDQLRFTPAFM